MAKDMAIPSTGSDQIDEENMNEVEQQPSRRTALSKWERVGIVSGYMVLFAIVMVVVLTLLDAYVCYSHGKVNGNIRVANIDLTSIGDVDMTMELTADAWLQSRLHTMNVYVAGCTVMIDTPSGQHLEMLHAMTSLPLTIKPKLLWSAWDGSLDDGSKEDPTYSVKGKMTISHVNFTSMHTMLTDAIVTPSTNLPHSMVVECMIDGAVELYSLPALSVPVKKYVYTIREDVQLNPSPTSEDTDGTMTSNHRALTLVTDIAYQMKSVLSNIPAIGSSFAMISKTDYESLVNNIASSPSALLNLFMYPFNNIKSAPSNTINNNVAQLEFLYDLHIPAKYVPSFLVNVYVPPLAVRMSSGTPGSGWSWMLSMQSFILDFSKVTTVDAILTCGNKVGNCTILTPVFGFVNNAFSNQKDSFIFDMMGDDNVVYRALGRHNDIRYSALLDYKVPASNFVVQDFGVSSCLNVTVSNRWSIRNACLKKQSGQPEVDVSFDIPSFDGTSGTYLGMSSAFTWSFASVSNNPTMPTVAPTAFPSMVSVPQCNVPWLGDGWCDPVNNNALCNYDNGDCCASTCISATSTCGVVGYNCIDPRTGRPSIAPTRSPTVFGAPTFIPTIAHTVALVVIQEIQGLYQNDVMGSQTFSQTFTNALESLKSDPNYPIPSFVTFTLQSVNYELYCPNCGWYVTRVRYTVTVLNNDGLLPVVSSNLASSVYTGTLQTFLQNTGGYRNAQINGIGSFRVQLPGSPTSQPTEQPTRQPSSQPSRQPSSQPSIQPTTHPTFKYRTPAPTLPQLNTLAPTLSPLSSDGCVHVDFTSLQSQTYMYNDLYVPSFGRSGDQVYYNVTMILAGGYAYFGSSSGNSYESGQLYQGDVNTPKEFGPFSMNAGDSGVLIHFYPYYVGSYIRATVCPFQSVPTRMPTQIPRAVNVTAEGNALCAIGKAFNLANWPISTICQTGTVQSRSTFNSSGMPVWCKWPYLTCNPRSKAVVAFDTRSNFIRSTIPTALGSLSNLQRLSLAYGQLTGTIPTSIFSSLNQLTYLSMAGNSLMGTIPSTINVAFVPLKGETQLDLSWNYLTGTVPSTFSKFQYMYLANNKVQLSMYGNCFLTSPISSIRNTLYSQGHCLTTPSSASIAAEGVALCQIAKALSNVVVTSSNGQNSVTTYPFGPYVYFQGTSIRHGYNPANSTCAYDITKPVYQPTWCQWTWGNGYINCDAQYSITSLSISGTSWTKVAKVPTAIASLTNLQYLQLNNAGLSGPIPTFLGGLSRLTTLNLQNNMLTRSVPAFVNNVWYPYLYNNCNLTSSIPAISGQVASYNQGFCSNDRNVIAAEGQAICKIAQALSSFRINLWNGNTYVPKPVFSNSYPGDTSLRYGYNPANSTCYYDTSTPLHTPDWCKYWNGIYCSNGYKVTSLSIYGSSWTTTSRIPTALGALGNLQSLSLNGMGLSGSIPNLMGLSRLTFLQLSNNMLTGVVPQFINRTAGNNDNYVYLGNNCNLTSPIPKISARLPYQGVQYCKPNVAAITAEGQAMCAIAQAWSSNMQVSQWTGHNSTMTNVFGSFSYTSDQTLKRTGYIPGKTACSYYTNGTHTSTSSYLPTWCNWPGVYCSNNRVSSISINYPTWTQPSKIPTALNALGNLQSLSVISSALYGTIPNLVGLSKLQTLQLYGNSLTGAVPAFINTMTTRPNTQVSLQTNCNLTWTSTSPMATGSSAYYGSQGNCLPLKPADIAAEGLALCSLGVGRTFISGWNIANGGCSYDTSKPVYRPPWCSWVGVSCTSAYSINSLSVSSSSWNSSTWKQRTIPASIAGLKGLTSLSLNSMSYTGSIPTALFSLTRLNTLQLSSNSLSGSISTAIVNLKSLQTLILSYNRFNSTLSTVLLRLPQLNYLSMQSNSIRGTIPTSITTNTALNQLYLDGNQFSGSIPRAIGNLTNLRSLGLSNNVRQTCGYKMVGQNSVYSCSSVGGINGTLPAEIYTLKSLYSINLGGNFLIGTISPSISALSSLQSVTLSGNKLSGSIPPSIAAMSSLQYVALSGNRLSSTIPSTLSSLSQLFVVNLDNNRLTGSIPNIFGKFIQNGQSYRLLLHNNYLTGAVPSMPYSYGQFISTFDQNCQLTSAYPAVFLSTQTHCKPGNAGQLTPTAFPSKSPTVAPVVPLPASGASYVQITFSLNMYFGQVYNYNTNRYTYPNVTAISNPMAPTALANALADVLFLPQSAVSINSFTPFGYYGGSSVGGYFNPKTTASVTLLYQGTGLIPRINAIIYAFYEAIYAVTSQEQSPLGNALIKYGFPNANTLTSMGGQTMASASFFAGQPTPVPTSPPSYYPVSAPTTYYPLSAPSFAPLPAPSPSPSTNGPSLLNLSPTKSPASLVLTGAPSTLYPALHDTGFQLSSLATVFANFGGDIRIRGKQGPPVLNGITNFFLQAAGTNALPQTAQNVPLQIGSLMHDGRFKYDLSTLLRTGKVNFTGTAIVEGNQLREPLQGWFQALYYLGQASIQYNQASSSYLGITRYNGTSSSGNGLTRPTSAPSGTTVLTPTVYNPVVCAAGQFMSAPGICQACPAGSYSIGGPCVLCPAGLFSNAGASTCGSCIAGYWSSGFSQVCSACPLGWFSPMSGVPCQLCPAGTYSNNLASTACRTCTGTNTVAGSTSCPV